MTGATIELFAYPWDILDRGPEAFIDECKDIGINRIHATTLYHSGKFLLPRNRASKVYFPEPGRLFVPVDPHTWETDIRPETSPLAESGWLDRLSAAARQAGMGLAAWTVFHHNSTLAAKHPEFAVRNLFGDIYPFALCPSHAAVRQYSVSLATAIASLGAFDRLDLETIGYLGYEHGFHHEVTAIPAGVLERFLLSLCFCPGCRSAAQQAGIAVEELRSQLERLLCAKIAADDSTATHPDNREQLLTLIVLSEPLQAFLRLRIRIVSELVRCIQAAIAPVKLSVFTSSFVGSPSNIWMEGVSMPDLQNDVDGFHLLAYSAEEDRVNSDVDFCLAQLEDARRLNLTINLGLPITPTLANAVAKVRYAWQRGVRRYSFFNYGFLGPGRLRWLKEIANIVRSLDTTAEGAVEAGSRL
jgi:hypothetical protein